MRFAFSVLLTRVFLQMTSLSSFAAGSVECRFPDGYSGLSGVLLSVENGSCSFLERNGDSFGGELETEISLKPSDFETSDVLSAYRRTAGLTGADDFVEARFFVTRIEPDGLMGYHYLSGLITFLGKDGAILKKGFAIGPINHLIRCLP